MISSAYRLLLRPLLFRMPPETAHKMAVLALKRRLAWRTLAPALRVRDDRLKIEFCGLRMRNPIGIAAGFDKDCEILPALSSLGFGYLVVGTVTEDPRPGNPRPRLLRYVAEESLINSLGFPGKGLAHALRELERARPRLNGTPVVVSVSGTVVDEIVLCHHRLEPLVDAVEVNISSPNTAGLKVFHDAPALADLLGCINDGRTKPLLVKLPPYPAEDAEAREGVLELVAACLREGVDALTVSNTRPTKEPRLAMGVGGLSGRAVFPDTLRMVSEIHAEAGGRLDISACGGIFSGDEAWRAMKAGAATVQLYTGLVYRGPDIVRRIGRELLDVLDSEGLESISSLQSPD